MAANVSSTRSTGDGELRRDYRPAMFQRPVWMRVVDLIGVMAIMGMLMTAALVVPFVSDPERMGEPFAWKAIVVLGSLSPDVA